MNSTRQELRDELDAMITASEVDNFWKESQKNDWINYAGRRVVNWTNWKQLRHALKTQSEKGKEWYKMPGKFKPGSLFRITMDDTDGKEHEYEIEDWEVYEKQQSSESEKKVSAVLGDQYFIYPTPPEDNLEIGIYGYLAWQELGTDTDESILNIAFDESIVKLAFAQCLKKEKRFAEAQSEIEEVENRENGLLATINAGQQTTQPSGYAGQAKSSRWDN